MESNSLGFFSFSQYTQKLREKIAGLKRRTIIGTSLVLALFVILFRNRNRSNIVGTFYRNLMTRLFFWNDRRPSKRKKLPTDTDTAGSEEDTDEIETETEDTKVTESAEKKSDFANSFKRPRAALAVNRTLALWNNENEKPEWKANVSEKLIESTLNSLSEIFDLYLIVVFQPSTETENLSVYRLKQEVAWNSFINPGTKSSENGNLPSGSTPLQVIFCENNEAKNDLVEHLEPAWFLESDEESLKELAARNNNAFLKSCKLLFLREDDDGKENDDIPSSIVKFSSLDQVFKDIMKDKNKDD